MRYATISGDIIAYTSLNDREKSILGEALQTLVEKLEEKFGLYMRIVKGDYLECVLSNPQDALRVALAIKSYIKSIFLNLDGSNADPRLKLFKTYGIRLAIGYGTLNRFDPEKGIIDGEAIYMSGRMIESYSTYNKKRIVIKNTLFFISDRQGLNKAMEPVIALIDVLINKATAKQSRTLYLKLTGHSEKEIAKELKVSQPVINQQSSSVGWNALKKSMKYFESII